MAKTAEEQAKIREEALKTLAEHKEELDKFQTKIDDEEGKWQDEIENLERSVETHIVNVPIGDKKKGKTIAIRGSLSDFEMGEISELDNIRKTLNLANDLKIINQITYVMLGIILANPIMTSEWLANHRTKYSTESMLNAYLVYQEQMVTRAERIAKIQNFRR